MLQPAMLRERNRKFFNETNVRKFFDHSITSSRFFFSKHQDVFFHQRLEKQITNQEAMEEEDRLAEVGVGKQRKTAAGKFQGPPRGTASHPYLEDHPS